MDDPELAVLLGLWASIPVDFLVKVAQIANLTGAFVSGLPRVDDPVIGRLITERALKLNCLSNVHAGLWNRVMAQPWSAEKPVRKSYERRAVLIELDSLAALALGISADELCIIYRTQFPVLRGYEQNDLYDANGRKVPGDMNRFYRKVGENLTLEERTWTHPQSGVEYVFEFPFQSFDREEDMRKAYAHFSSMLEEKA